MGCKSSVPTKTKLEEIRESVEAKSLELVHSALLAKLGNITIAPGKSVDLTNNPVIKEITKRLTEKENELENLKIQHASDLKVLDSKMVKKVMFTEEGTPPIQKDLDNTVVFTTKQLPPQ